MKTSDNSNSRCRPAAGKGPLKVLISGSSLSGNKGAMAMTLVLTQQLRLLVPSCSISLLSKYPAQDRPLADMEGIALVPARPSQLVSTTLARSVLAALLHCRPAGLLGDGILRAYRQADVVIDLGGVTFSDDRDWKGLLLSAGWVMPALAGDVPYVKLSQAMGPFNKTCNRLVARALLRRCPLLIARGEATAWQVQQLLKSPRPIPVCADIAFLLGKAGDGEVDSALRASGAPEGGFVGISPSAVVARKLEGKVDYAGAMANLVRHIRSSTGKTVVMVPHAQPQGKAPSEDLQVGRAIMDHLGQAGGGGVILLEGDFDARLLKGIIARSEAFIACRFHAMVAALGCGVATLVIGWGHKYLETMRLLGLESYTHPMESVGGEEISSSFDHLWRNRCQLRDQMAMRWPAVRESSMENFRLLEGFLRSRGLI